MEERLQKILAEAGICSRRKAEVLIGEGRVKVNGVLVTELDRMNATLHTLEEARPAGSGVRVGCGGED